jgi:hypothetical protein
MGKDNIVSSTSRRASIDETIPDALFTSLGEPLKTMLQNQTTDAVQVDDTVLTVALMDAVQQVIDGSLKTSQFIALLKKVNCTAEAMDVNVCIVNVLWMCGTQV